MYEEKADLFHLYIQKGVRKLSAAESFSLVKFLMRYFVKDVARSLRSLVRPANVGKPLFKNRRLVFANTYNNYEALKFLLDKFPGSELVCAGGYVSKLSNSVNVAHHLSSFSSFQKYLFIVYLALMPKMRLRHYKHIVTAYGFIDSYVRVFKHNEPECIFISNDHSPESRAVILAARRLGIVCIYLQHASVSEYFPPMRANYALLYGEYSKSIYSKISGTDGQLINVGNHKFDRLKGSILEKMSTGKIGIAYNSLDVIPDVLNFCSYLSKYFPEDKLILRPHPSDRRKIETRFYISRSEEESSVEFLREIDVLIAGNSSILLEAASMNVNCYQINFTPVPSHLLDYYGFIKSGIAKEINDWKLFVDELANIISVGKFDSRAKTKIYDASVGESYEFDVENYISMVIERILKDECQSGRSVITRCA